MSRAKNSANHNPLRPWATLAPHMLRWYDTVHHLRAMPWRQTRDPYAIWLSETMLQQTQVATVKAYFEHFLTLFPTVEALAKADLDAVLTAWAGLGYYRRARHLHAAAKAMVERHAGQVPRTLEELVALPGVGRYTAGAVASIAFGLPAPVVDGNIKRVVARLSGFDRDIADPKNDRFFWESAGQILRGATRYGDLNQSLMELGATVCVPPLARPACLICPVKEFCRAFAEGRQLELPVKSRKKAVPEVRGVAVVLLRSDGGTKRRSDGEKKQALMMRRPSGVTWEGMWEFPVLGGSGQWSVASGQTGRKGGEILGEWIAGELGLVVEHARNVGGVVHTLTHRRMVYSVVRAEVMAGEATLPPCLEGGQYVEARWVPWPLEKGKPGGVAYGRVVEKIAAAASAAV